MFSLIRPNRLLKDSLMSHQRQELSPNSILTRSSKSLWYYVFLLLLQCTITLKYNLISEASVDVLKSLLRASAWISVLWLLYILPKWQWLRKTNLSLGLFISIALFLIEYFLLARYSTVYTVGIAFILAGTNLSEVEEFCQNSFFFVAFVTPIIYILLSLLISYGIQWLINKLFNIKSRLYISVITIVGACISILLSIYPSYRTWEKVVRSRQAYDYTISSYDRILWNSLGFAMDYLAIKKVKSQMDRITIKELSVTPTFDKYSLIIIIGESLRRDYMHCYGYSLPNTPQIDSLISKGDMIAFDDAISPGASTISSLTKIMTMKTLESSGQWYEYPSLVTILNKYGKYYSSWVSNQEGSGAFIQPINTLAQLSNEVHYTSVRSIDAEHDNKKLYLDEDVLPLLKNRNEVKTKDKLNLLQVIHLMGSHHLYENRYPKHFARFQTKNIHSLNDTEKDLVLASYVNSVYYNDYVIGEIVNKYAYENSIIIYFSDHGEILYDDPRNPNYHDHGMLPQGVQVPFLIYVSPSMQNQYPDLKKRLSTYSKRPILLDSFTHAIVDFVGIKSEYTDRRNNFLSSDYIEPVIRRITEFGKTLEFASFPVKTDK